MTWPTGSAYGMLVDDVAGTSSTPSASDTFHLLGFSMGAMTALQFASRYPERLRTLVVVGITTQREPRASVVRRLMDPARIGRDDPAWAALLGRRHDPVQGGGAWRRLAARRSPAMSLVQDLLGPRDLRRIALPALVAVGDHDPFVPVDHAWGLMRQLPDARLFVAPGCGHEVMVRRPGPIQRGAARGSIVRLSWLPGDGRVHASGGSGATFEGGHQ